MNEKHTKAPWQYKDGEVFCNKIGKNVNCTIAVCDTVFSDFSPEVVEANGKRIIACINACEGIPTPLLKEAGENILDFTVELKKKQEILIYLLCGVFEAGIEVCYTRNSGDPSIARLQRVLSEVESELKSLMGEG